METIKIGPDKKFKLKEPLDTWLTAGLRDFAVPEAVGSSARVFGFDYPPLAGDFADFPAIKIMRPDKTTYALPLFENEVRILDMMKDVPGITQLIGLGYLKVVDGQWPGEIAPLSTSLQAQASASQVSGIADLYSPNEIEPFLAELTQRVSENWLAYLILPRRWEDNLYLRCDSGYTRGEFHRTFPVIQALRSAAQIGEIMTSAHKKGIVYLDHKILHYYWNEPRQQVFALDWNIGRQVNNSHSQEIFEFDILQFSARALHHLLTGRQAPGSVKVGPNKPEDIQNAPHEYEPIWTYDDQKRLTQNELDFLAGAIKGEYSSAQQITQDLQTLYNQRQSQG